MIIFIWFLMSVFVALFAVVFNRSGLGWLLLSIITSPIISVVALLAVGKKKPKAA